MYLYNHGNRIKGRALASFDLQLTGKRSLLISGGVAVLYCSQGGIHVPCVRTYIDNTSVLFKFECYVF